ncbi:DUF4405 domain-containing protein [Blautia producta]|uniref:DUF4405 domain-containing protein n=1 Tax=Blautia producta TaxID=33035 RepID=UPI0031B5C245
MKRKIIFKIAVDIGMTFMLLLLMTYELIGAAAHEWLGIGMFLLFVIHHILNSRWSRNIFKGKYSPLRILQTILVAGVFLTMAGSMFSGVILSEYALSFLPIKGGRDLARGLHMLSAYWGFVLMSLHIGFHWSIVTSRLKKLPKVSKWLSRIGILIAGYGVYAFTHRAIGRYMTLKNHFVFFDFDEPLIFFLADYIAVMTLFVVVGYCLFKGIKYAVRWQNKT